MRIRPPGVQEDLDSSHRMHKRVPAPFHSHEMSHLGTTLLNIAPGPPLGGKEPSSRSFQYHGGQNSALICARVDPQPVAPGFGFGRYGVTMHNEGTEIGTAIEERPADPPHLHRILVFERHPRTHASMDKQVAADAVGVAQAVQESLMLGGSKLRSRATAPIGSPSIATPAASR